MSVGCGSAGETWESPFRGEACTCGRERVLGGPGVG